ncbi:MAG: hypothetical protein LBH80_08620 [Prevotellaceae bacterium]|jgi:hypothetical protein|nr:hypothetical protein [Prevotellaceae bacterium]
MDIDTFPALFFLRHLPHLNPDQDDFHPRFDDFHPTVGDFTQTTEHLINLLRKPLIFLKENSKKRWLFETSSLPFPTERQPFTVAK